MFDDIFEETVDSVEQEQPEQLRLWDTGKKDDIWRITDPESIWRIEEIWGLDENY